MRTAGRSVDAVEPLAEHAGERAGRLRGRRGGLPQRRALTAAAPGRHAHGGHSSEVVPVSTIYI